MFKFLSIFIVSAFYRQNIGLAGKENRFAPQTQQYEAELSVSQVTDKIKKRISYGKEIYKEKTADYSSHIPKKL